MTKAFTATLVARLVEQGVIAWRTTVGEVLGDAVPTMLEAYKSINFLHLLSHRSGLQANLPTADFARFTRHIPDAREERLTWARLALTTPPACHHAYLYSNTGYIVAGAMLEVKTGTAWEELLRNHVCAPLGLSSVGFGAPGVRDKATDAVTHPVGHAPSGHADALRPYWPDGDEVNDNPAALGPAGRLHASISDLLKFLRAHKDQPTSFLRTETWQTLHTPPFGGDYALGWVVRPNGLWHNGSNTMWYVLDALLLLTSCPASTGTQRCALATVGMWRWR
jgi:CubicO group peptidase (beta-lactamase class C family)